MPRQVDGKWISDDGHWQWNGHAWQPVQPGPTGKPYGWLRVGLVVLGVLVVIGVLGAIGWLVAIAGIALVAAAYARPSFRSWAGWKRLPGLSGSRSAATFAIVLALYAVVAPAGIWALALAGSRSDSAQVSSPQSTTSNDGAVAVHTPAATSTPSPTPTPTMTPSSTPAPTPTPTPTPAPPPQHTTLLDLSGSGIKNSAEFNAPSHWKLTYSYDCTAFGMQGNFAVWVMDGTSPDSVAANELGTGGSSSTDVYDSGTVHLEINSECNWHVTAST